jgi:hypothetical protein
MKKIGFDFCFDHTTQPPPRPSPAGGGSFLPPSSGEGCFLPLPPAGGGWEGGRNDDQRKELIKTTKVALSAGSQAPAWEPSREAPASRVTG